MLLIRAILILPKNRRKLNSGSKTLTLSNQNMTLRVLQNDHSQQIGHLNTSVSHFFPFLLVKATLFSNEYLLRDQLCIGQSTIIGLKMKIKFTVKNTYVHDLHTPAFSYFHPPREQDGCK